MGMPLPPPRAPTVNQLRSRSRAANVGLAGACGVIFLLIYANVNQSVLDGRSAVFDSLLGLTCALSCLLWIMMWLEYFRERPHEYSLGWAFLLLTGPVLGPMLFYYGVWRVRLKAAKTPESR